MALNPSTMQAQRASRRGCRLDLLLRFDFK